MEETLELCAVVVTECVALATVFWCSELHARVRVHLAWLSQLPARPAEAVPRAAVLGGDHA